MKKSQRPSSSIVHLRVPRGSTAVQGNRFISKSLDGSDDSENCLFATTYIPLQLKTNDGFVLWSNPSPQSFRFCRPLKIQYRAGTKELILEENMRVENEINKLTPLYADTSAGQCNFRS